MTASYKIACFTRPMLRIKEERHLIHTFLLILILEIIFPGSLLLTMNKGETHMLLVQLAQMSSSEGKVVEGTWRLKDFQTGDKALYATKYIDAEEEIDSVSNANAATSIKSYGRTLHGEREGRWMFWYPGCVAKVIRRHGRSAPNGSDTFDGYTGVTGQPAAIGRFKDGHLTGWWKFYNPDGSLDITKTGYYENDTLMKRGKNPLVIPLIVLTILSLLVFDLLLAKVMLWLDVTFKKADTKFSHP